MSLRLRKVKAEDVRLVFDWANDPETRRNAFNPNEIPWESHVAWFNKRVDSPVCRIFILEQDNIAAGVIRFDKDDDDMLTISYSIDKNMRGKGLGKSIVVLGLEAVKGWGRSIKALVKPDNPASIRVFESLGFSRVQNAALEYLEFKSDN